METEKPEIDQYLFERQLEVFMVFVKEQSGVPFVSFASHPYTEEQEGYKYEIHRSARDALAFQTWKEADIGSGKIIAATIKSIEIPESNLVPWQSRFGKEARPHQPLYVAQTDPEKRKLIETCIFRLYHQSEEAESFSELVSIFGKTYPLLAYFYFIKDRSKYLPLAPTYLDRAFKLLGANFKTSRRCSWDNYSTYINLIAELKNMLGSALSAEVTVLDAHSFAWMLSTQLEDENKLENTEEYLNLSSTEREAIIKSRIGQGQFRQGLISYWSVCAVTGCGEVKLLRASHIKPWAKSTVTERLSIYNGLLLSPTLDACFDSGYITFSKRGHIVISKRLNNADLESLGIQQNMQLEKVEPEHEKYLAYHREHVFN